MTKPAPATPDPWTALRRHTAARIGLGRAGDSVPTERLLEFEVAHAPLPGVDLRGRWKVGRGLILAASSLRP